MWHACTHGDPSLHGTTVHATPCHPGRTAPAVRVTRSSSVGGAARAEPKSAMRTRPSAPISRLSGLRSPCTTPATLWRYATPCMRWHGRWHQCMLQRVAAPAARWCGAESGADRIAPVAFLPTHSWLHVMTNAGISPAIHQDVVHKSGSCKEINVAYIGCGVAEHICVMRGEASNMVTPSACPGRTRARRPPAAGRMPPAQAHPPHTPVLAAPCDRPRPLHRRVH